MREEKRKKLDISMERLSKLHDLVYNHPFRISRKGSINHYADLLDELGEVFLALVTKSFENSDIPSPFWNAKTKTIGWCWSHQYWSCLLSLRGKIDPQTSEYMVAMEHYLTTIHSFINKGILESFYMHVGYSSYDKKQHDENPMRSVLIVYYPQFKRWDMTKFWAKLELPRKLKDLEDDEAQVVKYSDPKDKSWKNYYQQSLDWSKKRVEQLKEIIEKDEER
jgi:hypothetical protein